MNITLRRSQLLRTGPTLRLGRSWKPFLPRRLWSAPANAALDKFLHTHKLYRPQTYQKRLELFSKATDFCASEPLIQAKSRFAVTRAKQLRVLQAQLEAYRQEIQRLFGQHPDHDLFGSLPGAGPKIAPRLLAEVGGDRLRFQSPQALQCYAGSAPVSYQSGPLYKVKVRGHCNKVLRHTLHLWANL
jgi:transposase